MCKHVKIWREIQIQTELYFLSKLIRMSSILQAIQDIIDEMGLLEDQVNNGTAVLNRKRSTDISDDNEADSVDIKSPPKRPKANC